MTTLGWGRRRWRIKVACVNCSKKIRVGITHVNDHADPPHGAMCGFCYNALLASSADEPFLTKGSVG